MMEFNSSDDKACNHIIANPKAAASASLLSPWLTPLAYFCGYQLLPLFFGQIKIIGKENIPQTGPVLIAPTHRARWDSLLLPYATGRGVTGRDLLFMVTITECRGLQGWFVRRLGGFPVDPEHPSITTLRHAIELLQRKEMLVIYPEGDIFRDGEVHPLKSGIARLALTAESDHPGLGIQILPIAINYSHPYPQWGTNVNIHIGSTIKVADYMNGSVKQEAKHLSSDLTKALQQLSHYESAITTNTFAEMPNS